uniref:Uncharacterized protein n=1 Tax=viral metagenome TaxID=1070528 RepID=A0A6C0HED9_9ZZZZ
MKNAVTIILTSTVNVNMNKSHIFQKSVDSRLETYMKSILQWLTKTNFNIVLVENSGYTFEELNNEKEVFKDRFEVFTFKEDQLEEAKYLKNNDSKGASELFAIDYAFEKSKLVHSTNFIIKITCRYFIPELEEYLSKYDLNDYDCLTQNDGLRCEMVGSHYNNFKFIFNTSTLNQYGNYTYHIEWIWKMRTSLCDNILVCKEFKIERTQRGGLEEIFDTI